MKKLSFKQYYDSKQHLLTELSKPITFKTTHSLYKYCKVPLQLDEERKYVAFKPNDLIVVEWQRQGDEITPLSIEINQQTHQITWNPKKMKSWVETSSTQAF